MRGREALLRRNIIKDASEQCLILVIDGRETSVPWSTVTGVSAGRAKLHCNTETWILLLAFEMEWDGRGRLLPVDGSSRPGSAARYPACRIAGDCALRGLRRRDRYRYRANRTVSALKGHRDVGNGPLPRSSSAGTGRFG